MSNLPSLKELLEAGVHFGHETKRWNPKMAKYIFAAKEKIHIIDLEKTEKALQDAVDYVQKLGSEGKTIVFLATKRQASEIVKTEAQRSGAMYMTTRWLGGLFTNFEMVNKSLAKMTELESTSKDDKYTKREQLLMVRALDKLERYVGGIRGMSALPEALFIVDSRKEDNAVKEAKKVNVTTIALVDTNADPTVIDYPIPGNDDAIRSISIIVKTIADSYLEGKELHAKRLAKEEKAEEAKEDKKEIQAKGATFADPETKPEVKETEKIKEKEVAKKEKAVTKKATKIIKPKKEVKGKSN